jgi:putative ABC transport system permease protein
VPASSFREKNMMNRMIVGNLVHRPVRSLISVVAIALEVTMILLIVGLSLGMLQDSRTRTAGIGADVLVLPPGSSFICRSHGAPMPIKVGGVLAKLPHVSSVAPVITQVASRARSRSLPESICPAMKACRPASAIWRAAVSRALRRAGRRSFCQVQACEGGRHDRDPEQQVPHLRHRGTRQGRAQISFPLATLQDLIGARDKATIFYLKLDDPANADAVVDEIKHVPGMERYVANSMASYLADDDHQQLSGAFDFHRCGGRHFVVIGFIVIFQAMYTAVMERTREIGILKSMGASKLYIVNVVLRETVLLALGGIVLGIVVSLAARAASGPEISAAAGGGGWRLDRPRHPDCDRRSDCRSPLSRLQSRAERSHRRPGVRIDAHRGPASRGATRVSPVLPVSLFGIRSPQLRFCFAHRSDLSSFSQFSSQIGRENARYCPVKLSVL